MSSYGLSNIDNDVAKLRLDSSPPIPLRENHRARNITKLFNEASDALLTGQLIKDECFALFDSVQALEIMDPKMDTGYLEPGETLEETYDVCRDVTPEEVIWIMDELLCYEMAWHHGYPLAQNVLTSVYMYNLLVQERLPNAMPYFRPLDGSRKEPPSVVQKVLRAFCVGIIKTCDIVIEMAQSQQFYEEEDLNTHAFALDLLTDVSDEEYFGLDRAAVDWISEQESSQRLSPSLCTTLLARLACRAQFLTLILPGAAQSQASVDSSTFIDALHSIAKKTPEDLKKPIEESFTTKLQRKLASTVPPRPIIKIPFQQALEDLGKIYQDIQEALKVDAFGPNTTIPSLTGFLWAFASREPLPFPRTVLQMFLFGEGKICGPGDGIKALLITDLRNLVVNQCCIQESFWDVEVPTDPRFQVARAVDFFLEQAPTEYINVLRSLCQNRCRIRRCLTNVVKDVDTLQTDLLRFFGKDPAVDSGSNFTSLMHHALLLLTKQLESDVMEWIIQLGFEQDVYQPFEMAYLQSYLAKLIHNKKTGYQLFMSQITSCRNEIIRVTGATKIVCPSLDPASESKDEEIWEALSLLHVTLARTRAIPPPQETYSSAERQLQLRMEPFLRLHHGVSIDARDFSMPEFRSVPLPDLLAQCSKHVVAARKRIVALRKALQDQGQVERREEERLEAGVTENVERYLVKSITTVLKACVRAGLAVEMLQRAVKEAGADERKLEGRVRATFEAPALGDYWIVPKVEILES